MKLKFGLALMLTAILTSCASRLTYPQLTEKVETSFSPSIVYRGSDSDGHHFDFRTYCGPYIFRPPMAQHPRAIVLDASTTIAKEAFPLTEDESKWRGYALYLSGPEQLYRDSISGRRFYEDFAPRPDTHTKTGHNKTEISSPITPRVD